MKLSIHMDPNLLRDYLFAQQWIDPSVNVLGVEKPGEGNMNLVLRVLLTEGSLILKQSLPFVHKYPEIPAPLDRIQQEYAFYRFTSSHDRLGKCVPGMVGFDKVNRILALEDLGQATDFTSLYQKGVKMTEASYEQSIGWLHELHRISSRQQDRSAFPDSRELRQLNHQHLFVYPLLADNGLDLDAFTPGLKEAASRFHTDEYLRDAVHNLGVTYLEPGPVLLHGDYYPGSWLNTSEGFRVIDAEFGYFGRMEFDLGVFRAHLDLAEQAHLSSSWIDRYYSDLQVNNRMVRNFQGIEIMRRIIGLAQLPLDLNLKKKEELLGKAYELIME